MLFRSLVFGSGYDKTRLTEYAAALSHAHRLELERGALAGYLADADGGLKGVVNAERRLRLDGEDPELLLQRFVARALAESRGGGRPRARARGALRRARVRARPTALSPVPVPLCLSQ